MAIFALVLIGLLVGKIQFDQLVAPLLSICGSFFGATFAFRLSERREAFKLDEQRIEILNRALVVALRQAHAVDQMNSLVSPWIEEIERGFLMPAYKPPPYADLLYPIADLSFLIALGQPAILMDLSVEQERFHQAMECLNLRNKFLVEEVEPVWSDKGLERTTTSRLAIYEALGDRIFCTALEGAARAAEQMSHSAKSTWVMYDRIFRVSKTLYPGAKFIRIDKTKKRHSLNPDETLPTAEEAS